MGIPPPPPVTQPQIAMNNVNDPLYIASFDHPDMVLTNTSFNGTNFHGWSRNIKMALGKTKIRVLANGQTAEVHPTSVLCRTKSECIIFYSLVQTSRNYVRNVTIIDYLWLAELAPQCYGLKD
uniref:Pre-mRNA-splicing factor ATP-dependent RNA helicase DEAH10 n=1 Tax=Tanacetum cinerariifolium TaxID=118510 RepID=A0A699J241_TANCI|nr:pre-mRNA-splicing factor ATP-dependent RNA helicase DEAH10 [Tanacetum cinerariifolium]